MMSRDTRIIRSVQDMDRHRLAFSLKQEICVFTSSAEVTLTITRKKADNETIYTQRW